MLRQLTVTLSDSDFELLEQCFEFDHPSVEHSASVLLSFAIQDTVRRIQEVAAKARKRGEQ